MAFTLDLRRHTCPDCKCPPPCDQCGGSGFISVTDHGESYDRGDGVIYGSSSYTSKRCPNNCPPPRVYL